MKREWAYASWLVSKVGRFLTKDADLAAVDPKALVWGDKEPWRKLDPEVVRIAYEQEAGGRDLGAIQIGDRVYLTSTDFPTFVYALYHASSDGFIPARLKILPSLEALEALYGLLYARDPKEDFEELMALPSDPGKMEESMELLEDSGQIEEEEVDFTWILKSIIEPILDPRVPNPDPVIPRLVGHTGIAKSAYVEALKDEIVIPVRIGGKDYLMHPRVSVTKVAQFDKFDFTGMTQEYIQQERVIFRGDPVSGRVEPINIPAAKAVPTRDLVINSDQAVNAARKTLAELLDKGWIRAEESADGTHYFVTLDEETLPQDHLDRITYLARPAIWFLDEFARSDAETVKVFMTLFTSRNVYGYDFKKTAIVIADNMVLAEGKDREAVDIYNQFYTITQYTLGTEDPAIARRFKYIEVSQDDPRVQAGPHKYLSQKYGSDLDDLHDFIQILRDVGSFYRVPDVKKGNEYLSVDKLPEKYPTFRGWEYVFRYLSWAKKNNKPVYAEIVEGLVGPLGDFDLKGVRLGRMELKTLKDLFLVWLQEGGEVQVGAKAYTLSGLKMTYVEERIAMHELATHSAGAGVPILLLGRPGIAKTYTAFELARRFNQNARDAQDIMEGRYGDAVMIISVAGSDRTATKGKPSIRPLLSIYGREPRNEKEAQLFETLRKHDIPATEYAPSLEFKAAIERLRADKNAYFILLFDEINRADPTTQSIVFEVISNSRYMGIDFRDVRDRVIILATGNYIRKWKFPDDETEYAARDFDHATLARFATIFREEITEQDIQNYIEYLSRALWKNVPTLRENVKEETWVKEFRKVWSFDAGEFSELWKKLFNHRLGDLKVVYEETKQMPKLFDFSTVESQLFSLLYRHTVDVMFVGDTEVKPEEVLLLISHPDSVYRRYYNHLRYTPGATIKDEDEKPLLEKGVRYPIAEAAQRILKALRSESKSKALDEVVKDFTSLVASRVGSENAAQRSKAIADWTNSLLPLSEYYRGRDVWKTAQDRFRMMQFLTKFQERVVETANKLILEGFVENLKQAEKESKLETYTPEELATAWASVSLVNAFRDNPDNVDPIYFYELLSDYLTLSKGKDLVDFLSMDSDQREEAIAQLTAGYSSQAGNIADLLQIVGDSPVELRLRIDPDAKPRGLGIVSQINLSSPVNIDARILFSLSLFALRRMMKGEVWTVQGVPFATLEDYLFHHDLVISRKGVRIKDPELILNRIGYVLERMKEVLKDPTLETASVSLQQAITQTARDHIYLLGNYPSYYGILLTSFRSDSLSIRFRSPGVDWRLEKAPQGFEVSLHFKDGDKLIFSVGTSDPGGILDSMDANAPFLAGNRINFWMHGFFSPDRVNPGELDRVFHLQALEKRDSRELYQAYLKFLTELSKALPNAPELKPSSRKVSKIEIDDLWLNVFRQISRRVK